MRILVFGLSCQRGGVESFILSYCKKLKEIDPSISFNFLVIDAIPGYAFEAGIPQSGFLVVPNRIKRPFGYREGLKQIFKSVEYDLFWYNSCTLSDITPVAVAASYGLDSVVHSHNSENMGNALNGLLHELHKRRVEQLGSLFLACSKSAGVFFYPPSILDSTAFSILPNAIDTERFRFSPELRNAIRRKYGIDKELLFGHVGRFHFQKNHEYLVRIFFAIHKDIPNAKLLLVGAGELLGQVRRQVEDLGLSHNVIFAGESDNVSALYSAMDFFLFPSVFEGFGLAALEAQASGLPCLISLECKETPVAIDGCKKISIKETPESWADAVSAMLGEDLVKRDVAADIVNASGYGLAASARQLLSYFEHVGDSGLIE